MPACAASTAKVSSGEAASQTLVFAADAQDSDERDEPAGGREMTESDTVKPLDMSGFMCVLQVHKSLFSTT